MLAALRRGGDVGMAGRTVLGLRIVAHDFTLRIVAHGCTGRGAGSVMTVA